MALSGIRPLPPNALIEPCTEQHIQAFRRMNQTLLPIPYQDSFYKETMNDPIISSITRIGLWCDDQSVNKIQANPSIRDGTTIQPSRVVAGIRCRLLLDETNQNDAVLYISTLTTLAPFRGHGFAGHLLSTVAETAVQDYGVVAIVAHVWEANNDGLEWYRKHAFRIVKKEEMYYRRLAPQTAAFLVRRDIGPSDVLSWRKKRDPQ